MSDDTREIVVEIGMSAPPISEQLEDYFSPRVARGFDERQAALVLLFKDRLIEYQAFSTGCKILLQKIKEECDRVEAKRAARREKKSHLRIVK